MKCSILAAVLALSCTLAAPAAHAAEQEYTDIQGHWAQGAIERWSGYGVVNGSNGLFKPNDSLTRAQMAVILTNTLGLPKATENPFTDVPSGMWYTDAVLSCCEAGILGGYDGKADPGGLLSRQQAMTMLCRALNIAPTDSPDLSAFADGSEVAGWAAPSVAAMVATGLVGGVDGNRLAPNMDMNRAAMMTVLDRAVAEYINTPGSYALPEQAPGRLVLVTCPGVTLTGTTDANVLLTEGTASGEILFDGATVTGTIQSRTGDVTVAEREATLPQYFLPEPSAPAGPVEGELLLPFLPL